MSQKLLWGSWFLFPLEGTTVSAWTPPLLFYFVEYTQRLDYAQHALHPATASFFFFCARPERTILQKKSWCALQVLHKPLRQGELFLVRHERRGVRSTAAFC